MNQVSELTTTPVEPILKHRFHTVPLPVEELCDDAAGIVVEPARRMQQYFERSADTVPGATALICGETGLTYQQLDQSANRLAHWLIERGTRPGDTLGLLMERSVSSYVALLAILKAGAAFVPIDPSYPADRVAFIVEDAAIRLVLTSAELAATHVALGSRLAVVGQNEPELASYPVTRPEISDAGDSLAYIIYTSGTTGKPKGVAVNHSSICFFLSVCTPIYGVSAGDRVYQGMTMAFDFSIEEIWPAWLKGAAVVAGPTGSRRIGSGLTAFLAENRVTVLCAVPTLLATLDRELPLVHTLVVGGEACPRDLVERWSYPGRRILNTYGPTETTVTASWSELEPGKPITIGRPMPGYRMYVLDEKRQPVAAGEAGEIYIGGKGVSAGYRNRPELTESRFVADPFLPGRRMYRSGDLGRFAANGEIEFLGRIDTQVKIRGFRIELGEIEAILLENPAVENAVVSTTPPGVQPEELVAYLKLRVSATDAGSLREVLAGELRHRLPAYMVPAYIEFPDAIPTLASGKTDRKQLPPPVLPRLTLRSGNYVAPSTPLEETIAAEWRAVFNLAEVSVVADFFLDFGGHSLFAAQVVSRLRRQERFRRASIADLYAHPTVRGLAEALDAVPDPASSAAPRPQRHVLKHSDTRVRLAGVVQFVLLYGMLAVFLAPIAALVLHHAHAGLAPDAWDALIPALLVGLSVFLPVVLKWTLIGRFRSGTYPLWGSYYCRWWIVRKALDLSPLSLLAGSPLMPFYARLLGARVGEGCQIATAHLHLPDLIEIGDRASIGYEVEIQPFVIEDGYLHMAPVHIGARAHIGTKSVLLLGATVGQGARIAEQTLVTRFQKIPAHQSWAGSPSQPANTTDALLEQMEQGPEAAVRPSAALWAGFLAAIVTLEILPIIVALPGLLLLAWAGHAAGLSASLALAPVAGLSFVLATCAVVAVGKRAVLFHARPGIYPELSLFGLRKWFADRLMSLSLTLTNSLYATLYIAPWLRLLGAKIGAWSEVSTVSHIDPDLLSLGEQTFVADLASIGAATFHNGKIALASSEIGNRTFIGNAAVIRGEVKLPGNSLIGVASVVPAAAMHAGSSWLGSPSIFLPKRQVWGNFEESVTYRPKPVLVAYRLGVEFFRATLPAALLFTLGILLAAAAGQLVRGAGPWSLFLLMPAAYFAAATAITLVVGILKWLIVGTYRPRVEPLWAPFVRHTELITGLYEGAVVPVLGQFLTGTPMAAVLLRLFGARMGRRVYLETTFLTEFDLVHVGDDSSIGRASSLQTHLFEDRVMKMSRVEIGRGCIAGPRAVVLYDSTLEDGARLDALSLAMKGETLPAHTRWCGIPAEPDAPHKSGDQAARRAA